MCPDCANSYKYGKVLFYVQQQFTTKFKKTWSSSQAQISYNFKPTNETSQTYIPPYINLKKKSYWVIDYNNNVRQGQVFVLLSCYTEPASL